MIASYGEAEGFPQLDHATLDLLPDPTWVSTVERDVAYVNAAWLERIGAGSRYITYAEFFAAIHPDDRERLTRERRASVGTELPLSMRHRIRHADGLYRWSLIRVNPIVQDGVLRGWLGTLSDVEAELSARAELADVELRSLSLANAVPQLIGVTSADGARVISVNDTYTAFTGLTTEAAQGDGWGSMVHPDDLPAVAEGWQNAVARGEPYETEFRLRRRDGAYRWMVNKAVPVRNTAGAITAWVGASTDIDERKRAEEAQRVLSEATSAFAGTLDTAVALQRLADISAQHLADWCGVYVYDAQRRLAPVAIAHRDPNMVRFVRNYMRRYPTRDDDAASIVASSGEPLLVNEITDDMYDTIEDPQQRALAMSLHLKAIYYAPLGTQEERLGVFSLAISDDDRRFTDEDCKLAMLIAQRAAIAIGNARLYERQREVARTLQASFLPPTLPQTADVAFDAVYAAGTSDLTVGGDWYDAFTIDDGLIEFSVGDVAGHGLDAAVPMGKMRQTFRALGAMESDPARAMVLADVVLRREHPDVFVTAFAATYDPAKRHLRYANAGHPPPFVRADNGTLSRLEMAGVPLGLGEFDVPRAMTHALRDGDLFVAFTDGLIETTHDIEQGERFVADALAHRAFSVCSSPAALLRVLAVPTMPGDDVAILAMRVGASGPDWSFDANDGGAAQAAREDFVRRLEAAGIALETCEASEIVFGEIVGNVARYTPGLVDMRLSFSGTTATLAALDRGPGFSWSPAPPADAFAESGRGLFLIETLSRAVRVEYLTGFGTYIEVTLDV
jgi:PAS domain S-box-containing protein